MEIELGQITRAFRRFWWIPITIGLVLGLIGFGTARFISPVTYTATSQILVNSQYSENGWIEGSARTSTYINLALSGPILDRVILELGLADEYNREELARLIEVESSGAQMIEIRVTTNDPDLSADIANSLTRHLSESASGLSRGEFERNIEEIEYQIDVHLERLRDIETRLDEIDTDDNADDNEIQAEISSLERERFRVSQTLADLERTARALNTDLATLVDPVVVTDAATRPEKDGGAINSVPLALLGIFVGGLIGTAWIMWSAFTDRKVRSTGQIVSHPLLARLNHAEFDSVSSDGIAVLGARINGVLKGDEARTLAIVSARDAHLAGDLESALSKADSKNFCDAIGADSALTNAISMRNALNASDAVIVAALNTTSIDDLEQLAEALASANTRIIGTVVVG